MASNKISIHRVRVFQFLATAGGWQTNRDIVNGASVAPRTAASLTKNLVELGILEQAAVFPAHRYRVSEHTTHRAKAYMDRLVEAAKIFGL